MGGYSVRKSWVTKFTIVAALISFAIIGWLYMRVAAQQQATDRLLAQTQAYWRVRGDEAQRGSQASYQRYLKDHPAGEPGAKQSP